MKKTSNYIKLYTKIFLTCCTLASLVLLSNCNFSNLTQPISKTSFKLNTIVSITLYDSSDQELLQEAINICDDFDKLFSSTNPDSEIYQLNNNLLNSSNSTYKLSPHTSKLIEQGLYYSQLSKGAFDITLKPLTSIWDFTVENPKVPSASTIEQALSNIGYQNISINNQDFSFLKDNIALDLGGIAKGYIADQIKFFLLSKGITSALIDLGGNVVTIGNKPNGDPFTIGIRKPFGEDNEHITTIEIADQSVVTSGNYQRYFEEENVLYHHILDPETGYPYVNDLLSVTIISPTSVEGDALSTACFGLGLEKGMELLNSIPDVEGIFITNDYKIHYTD